MSLLIFQLDFTTLYTKVVFLLNFNLLLQTPLTCFCSPAKLIPDEASQFLFANIPLLSAKTLYALAKLAGVLDEPVHPKQVL